MRCEGSTSNRMEHDERRPRARTRAGRRAWAPRRADDDPLDPSVLRRGGADGRALRRHDVRGDARAQRVEPSTVSLPRATDSPLARVPRLSSVPADAKAWAPSAEADGYDRGSGEDDDSPKARMARACRRTSTRSTLDRFSCCRASFGTACDTDPRRVGVPGVPEPPARGASPRLRRRAHGLARARRSRAARAARRARERVHGRDDHPRPAGGSPRPGAPAPARSRRWRPAPWAVDASGTASIRARRLDGRARCSAPASPSVSASARCSALRRAVHPL